MSLRPKSMLDRIQVYGAAVSRFDSLSPNLRSFRNVRGRIVAESAMSELERRALK